ncbi:LysR family transcriptional regulator [uncultured Cohaesibacter sp.]|uniref:LysR family transcriptional regulator n=1 Tax=uncultured Cohaesibacter sp. TaxID=1002546 RepID=UPI0029C88B87|nr:LysR family transcriptional regulator [uncultured Cohaesibacter sp.]
MTLEQLSIFVAVAERQHVTRAADAIGLTPSAVSASIKALEAFHNVQLFDRVGRGIALTETGRIFLKEAKATLARANAAALVLSELGGLKRGVLHMYASQTIASYWLPSRMVHFHDLYPDIKLSLTVGNTHTVARAIEEGQAEIGFVEGDIDAPLLRSQKLADDEIAIVVAPDHPLATARPEAFLSLIKRTYWVMREQGSGTRSTFEAAISRLGLSPDRLKIALEFPSNEAVLSALVGHGYAGAVSRMAAQPLIATGAICFADVPFPPRDFMALSHRERALSPAAREFLQLCQGSVRPEASR